MIRLHGVTSGGVVQMDCGSLEQAERTIKNLDNASALPIEWTMEER